MINLLPIVLCCAFAAPAAGARAETWPATRSNREQERWRAVGKELGIVPQ